MIISKSIIICLSFVTCWSLLVSVDQCSAFSIRPSSHHRDAITSAPTCTVTREGFLQNSLAVLIGGTSGGLLLSSPAHAAVGVQSQLSYTAALRNVRSGQKKLGALELYVTEDEYASLKEALRVSPLSEIRKSCTTLIRAASETDIQGAEGVSIDGEQLEARYKSFISSLEKMDGTASQAMRGKTLQEGEFYGTYRATVAALDEFLALAQEKVSTTM